MIVLFYLARIGKFLSDKKVFEADKKKCVLHLF